jgi:hypothetical protein
MYVGAQEVLTIAKELGKKLVTGDALMDHFKRPYSLILTKDMFRFLFRNIESMAKEIAAAGSKVEPHALFSFLSILRIMEAHLTSLKICRIKLSEITDRPEILTFSDIISKNLSVIKPNEGTEEAKEVFLSISDKL